MLDHIVLVHIQCGKWPQQLNLFG